MPDITCEDCGAARRNATFKNTRYCNSDRLLRDLVYIGDRTKSCTSCQRPFAPVSRRDALCGRCNYGSITIGACAFCKRSDAELHRPGIAVCVKCVRDVTHRPRIIAGLRKGQATRRLANSFDVNPASES